MFGAAFGGGLVFDLAGSYTLAWQVGVAWSGRRPGAGQLRLAAPRPPAGSARAEAHVAAAQAVRQASAQLANTGRGPPKGPTSFRWRPCRPLPAPAAGPGRAARGRLPWQRLHRRRRQVHGLCGSSMPHDISNGSIVARPQQVQPARVGAHGTRQQLEQPGAGQRAGSEGPRARRRHAHQHLRHQRYSVSRPSSITAWSIESSSRSGSARGAVQVPQQAQLKAASALTSRPPRRGRRRSAAGSAAAARDAPAAAALRARLSRQPPRLAGRPDDRRASTASITSTDGSLQQHQRMPGQVLRGRFAARHDASGRGRRGSGMKSAGRRARGMGGVDRGPADQLTPARRSLNVIRWPTASASRTCIGLQQQACRGQVTVGRAAPASWPAARPARPCPGRHTAASRPAGWRCWRRAPAPAGGRACRCRAGTRVGQPALRRHQWPRRRRRSARTSCRSDWTATATAAGGLLAAPNAAAVEAPGGLARKRLSRAFSMASV